MARFILETDHPSRRIIRHTDNPSKYKSEDEFWRIICLDINRSRVSRRVSRCWAEWKPGESLNMAALVALLMKSRRTALDMAVYQRRISSVKRMFEPENSLMNFMLPFSLANLAQDRKTRGSDYTNGVITSSVLWVIYNFCEDVCVLICPSQLLVCFLLLFCDCFRGHDYFTGRHLEIGIPGNLAKL